MKKYLLQLMRLIASVLWIAVPAASQAQGTSIELTTEELKVFEGYYQFEKNQDAYLQFSVKDKGLTIKQMWDGKEFYLLPKTPLEFLSEKEKMTAKFSKGSNGKVTQVLVFDKDIWKKVPNYTPRKIISLSPQKLKALEGKYTFQFQPGQDAFLEIAAKDDHIILTEKWSGNQIKFSPLSDLEFVNQQRSFPLKFIRDNSGTVTKVLAFNRDLWTKVKQ